jgi:hypothetical protein
VAYRWGTSGANTSTESVTVVYQFTEKHYVSYTDYLAFNEKLQGDYDCLFASVLASVFTFSLIK